MGRSDQDENWDSFGVLISISSSIERLHMLPQINRVMYTYSFNRYLMIIYYIFQAPQ